MTSKILDVFYQKVVVSERKLLNSAQNWLFSTKNAQLHLKLRFFGQNCRTSLKIVIFRPKLLNIRNRIRLKMNFCWCRWSCDFKLKKKYSHVFFRIFTKICIFLGFLYRKCDKNMTIEWIFVKKCVRGLLN